MFCLEVSGAFACFTRPEMKVERVSYDVMTPSAARSIFEAILWKPAIQWQVHKIEVLEPICWMNLRRNEVGDVASVNTVAQAMKGGTMPHILADEGKSRQQRASLFLRDVRYRIYASFTMTKKAGNGDTPAKFAEMFRRRAANGQCFNQPYLGCREFTCMFTLVEGAPEQAAQPINETRDLGWMFYDYDYSQKQPQPRFFRAALNNGVLHVPAATSAEIFQ